MTEEIPVKPIEVYHDTRGVARCKGCGRRIEWAEIVASGKKMCFDEVVLLGKLTTAAGRQIDVVDLTKNHWATCRERKRFTRKERTHGR